MADPHSDQSDYHKGEMDIHEQASSYELFMNVTKWGSLVVTVCLLFFIVWFAVKGAGLMPAFISAAVVAVLGFYMLKKKPDAH
jgi:Bacterial aa3 type cytochrome c oxidase subunit IV